VVVELAEQPRQGGGADPGRLLQLERRPGSERDAGHPDPGRLPGFAGGVERVGLAGPGLADHDLHPGAGAGEPADHRLLLAGEGASTDRDLDRGSSATAMPASCRPMARLMARCSVSSSPWWCSGVRPDRPGRRARRPGG
jgi:hypothetical protein